MPPPHRIDPLEALALLVERLGRGSPERRGLKEALGGYLARELAIELVTGGTSGPIAACNLFAMPPEVRSGEVCTVLGLVTRTGVVRSALESGEAARGVWRVESGGAQPLGFDRAVRVEDATLVGSGRVRLDRIERFASADFWEQAPRLLSFPAGTFIDERLAGLLELAHVERVDLMPRSTVALAVLGDELSPPHSGQPRQDLTGPWLGAAIEGLGHTLIDLGLRPETAESVRDAILHCRGRAELLVLVGGLGDGVTDRTIEHLERFDAKLTFHGVACEGAQRLCHARALGMDIVGLGGKPLEAAAVFDLFLAPALLARQKASRHRWDWSLGRWKVSPRFSDSSEPAWRAFPARLETVDGGGWQAGPIDRAQVSSLYPVAPGQSGWVVLPPGEPSDAQRGYYQGRRGAT